MASLMRSARLVLGAAVMAGLLGSTTTAEEGVGMPAARDQAALRRGFEVFNQVCSACHGMSRLSFGDLEAIGFGPHEVEQIAAAAQIRDGSGSGGEMQQRPGSPADRLPSPFASDEEARAANGGVLPPDLSLAATAREGGTAYLYALLAEGYREPPAGLTLRPGLYYNDAFPGQQIGMPPPLSEGAVFYADGTEASVEQQARDVALFLAWAAATSRDRPTR